MGFFEQQYRQNPDPWNFTASPYEQYRYTCIIEELGGRFFERVFEPGCSIGVLTSLLAPLCVSVIAMDLAPTALRAAKERCRPFSNVTFVPGSIASTIPAGKFDLIVFSEIGYYFSRQKLREIGNKLNAKLSDSGLFLAVHWLGFSQDHVLSGDEVHAVLGDIPGLRHVNSQRHQGFRLDRWERS